MRNPGPGPVAAIDCGTNSTRLLVIDAEGRPLTREMRITRLGEGVDATHKLSLDAIERTVTVLGEYHSTMEALRVVRSRVVATSAVRDAVNGDEFLLGASNVVGVPAELLSGVEEGRLAHAGAVLGLPPVDGDDVVVDIGGGSTELVIERDGRIDAVSLALGCVRLTERHLRHDPPRADEVAAADAAIEAGLGRSVESIPALGELRPGSRLLGLAGTVTTLVALEKGLAVYQRDKVHHSRLSAVAVGAWCELLATEPAASRMEHAGMVEGRQDVIVGGALVLRAVMRRFGFSECLVSESDILDGLAATLRG